VNDNYPARRISGIIARMRKKPLLTGWKLYITAGAVFYALGLTGLLTREILRHPDRPVIDALPGIAVFTGIGTALFLGSIYYVQREREK
jgi:hypothetical protein